MGVFYLNKFYRLLKFLITRTNYGWR